MAFYRQNQGNVSPRNGTAPTRNAYPASLAVYGPEGLPPSMTNAGSTQPSGGFRAAPVFAGAPPVFGEHDGLAGRVMEVAQADLYLSMPAQPFPRSGVWDEPGGPIAASRLVRLEPSTSAHRGLAMATGAGPTMIFTAPPVFSVQTRPIYALGL